VKKLEGDRAYDPADWTAAMGKSLLWGEEIPIGKFLERTDVPTLQGAEPALNAGPLPQADTRIPVDVTPGLSLKSWCRTQEGRRVGVEADTMPLKAGDSGP
jgi:hypothetical protein